MRYRGRLVRTALTLATLAAAASAAAVTVLDEVTVARAVDAAAAQVADEVATAVPAAAGAGGDLAGLVDSAHLRRLVTMGVGARQQVPGPRGWILTHPRQAAVYAGCGSALLLTVALGVWPAAWRRTARAVAAWAVLAGAVPWAVVTAAGAWGRPGADAAARATGALVRELASPAVAGGQALTVTGLVALAALTVPQGRLAHLRSRATGLAVRPAGPGPGQEAPSLVASAPDPLPVASAAVRSNDFDPRSVD